MALSYRKKTIEHIVLQARKSRSHTTYVLIILRSTTFSAILGGLDLSGVSKGHHFWHKLHIFCGIHIIPIQKKAHLKALERLLAHPQVLLHVLRKLPTLLAP